MSRLSAGIRFRQAVKESNPLTMVGCMNAYFAQLVTQSGFKAVYLSGSGVAACSCRIPDLGITMIEDVLIDARRITDNADTPLLMDIDIGWSGVLNITCTAHNFERTGIAAVHIEGQVAQRRCDHYPNKAIVSKGEIVGRIKTAVNARTGENFVIMTRTDALAVEGLDAVIGRVQAYVETSADMIFPEVMTDLAMHRQFADAVKAPVLVSITEFGATPFYTQRELADNDVSLVLYPLSSFRAASKITLNVYEAIIRDGTQAAVADTMQTRAELYEHLDYHNFGQKLDKSFQK